MLPGRPIPAQGAFEGCVYIEVLMSRGLLGPLRRPWGLVPVPPEQASSTSPSNPWQRGETILTTGFCGLRFGLPGRTVEKAISELDYTARHGVFR